MSSSRNTIGQEAMRRANTSGSIGAGTLVEIVGVAQTIKYQSGFEKPMDFLYMPLAQHPVARMTLMLRSSGDPLQLVQSVKDVVRTLDPNLPIQTSDGQQE